MSNNRSEFSVLQLPRLQTGATGLGEDTERKGLKAFGVSGKFGISPGGRRTLQCDPGSAHVPRAHRDLSQLPDSCRGTAGATLGPVMARASTWWRQQRTGAKGEPARVTSHHQVPQPPSPGGSELRLQPHATTLLHNAGLVFSVAFQGSAAPLSAGPT